MATLNSECQELFVEAYWISSLIRKSFEQNDCIIIDSAISRTVKNASVVTERHDPSIRDILWEKITEPQLSISVSPSVQWISIKTMNSDDAIIMLVYYSRSWCSTFMLTQRLQFRGAGTGQTSHPFLVLRQCLDLMATICLMYRRLEVEEGSLPQAGVKGCCIDSAGCEWLEVWHAVHFPISPPLDSFY